MASIRTRLFQTWFRLTRPMTLGVRAVVENSDGTVLLVRHTYTKGLYFPGGGIEKGETAMQALRRELSEEAGVEPVPSPQLVGVYSNHYAFRNDHVLLYHVPHGSWETGETDNAGEISELVWADPSEPPGDTTPGTLRRLREMYAQGPNDGFW